MKITRTNIVTAAVAGAAALAATGVTYAAAASAPEAAPEAAPAAAAAAPFGGAGAGGGNNNNSNNNNNNGNNNNGNDDEDNWGKGGEGRGEGGHWGGGRIQINERSYSSHPGDCVTVVSGLGARTLNIRNDSDSRVEVFRGAVCDNGAPVAEVGRHSQSDGVRVGDVDGIKVKDGVVGSFRVVGHEHHEHEFGGGGGK
ncbi:hypothetical protein ACWC0C_00260 [Streptomyces sp. NPDC001709]